AKMTSSILPPRSVRGPWAPSTHATASTRFDFPEPLGPTTTVTPGSNSRTVLSANDLKPRSVSDLRNTWAAPTRVKGWGGGGLSRIVASDPPAAVANEVRRVPSLGVESSADRGHLGGLMPHAASPCDPTPCGAQDVSAIAIPVAFRAIAAQHPD